MERSRYPKSYLNKLVIRQWHVGRKDRCSVAFQRSEDVVYRIDVQQMCISTMNIPFSNVVWLIWMPFAPWTLFIKSKSRISVSYEIIDGDFSDNF